MAKGLCSFIPACQGVPAHAVPELPAAQLSPHQLPLMAGTQWGMGVPCPSPKAPAAVPEEEEKGRRRKQQAWCLAATLENQPEGSD